MTNAWPVLSLVTFLPLVGCFFIMLTRGDGESVAKSSQYIALWTSIPTFIISLFIWVNFNPNSPGFQMIERVPWMPSIGISYQMGIDGISIFFILSKSGLCSLSMHVSYLRGMLSPCADLHICNMEDSKTPCSRIYDRNARFRNRIGW